VRLLKKQEKHGLIHIAKEYIIGESNKENLLSTIYITFGSSSTTAAI